jgi:hypothetical protein
MGGLIEAITARNINRGQLLVPSNLISSKHWPHSHTHTSKIHLQLDLRVSLPPYSLWQYTITIEKYISSKKMHLFQFTTAAFPLALSSRATAAVVDSTQVADIKARALGLNCEGSSFCYKGAMENIVSTALPNTGGCSAAPG